MIFFGAMSCFTGNGSLYGKLSGNAREICHKFSVDLPKKHGRGGQSALRFARLRMEKRHNYVRKVAEEAVRIFITNDKVNVSGLILAGSAGFKTELSESDMFDGRLKAKIIKIVDVSYGGENGFNQAIELSAETLGNVKFIQEKKLICKFFDEIALDSGRCRRFVSLYCHDWIACSFRRTELLRMVTSLSERSTTIRPRLSSGWKGVAQIRQPILLHGLPRSQASFASVSRKQCWRWLWVRSTR
jgi:hypothetical protein